MQGYKPDSRGAYLFGLPACDAPVCEAPIPTTIGPSSCFSPSDCNTIDQLSTLFQEGIGIFILLKEFKKNKIIKIYLIYILIMKSRKNTVKACLAKIALLLYNHYTISYKLVRQFWINCYK